MADRVMSVSLVGDANQTTITDASSGSAASGLIKVVILDGTTNAQLRRALRIAAESARRDPTVMTGV